MIKERDNVQKIKKWSNAEKHQTCQQCSRTIQKHQIYHYKYCTKIDYYQLKNTKVLTPKIYTKGNPGRLIVRHLFNLLLKRNHHT